MAPKKATPAAKPAATTAAKPATKAAAPAKTATKPAAAGANNGKKTNFLFSYITAKFRNPIRFFFSPKRMKNFLYLDIK